MEQSNIENQVMPHTCASNKERVVWVVLVVVALVLGIIIGVFFSTHSSNSNGVSALAQQHSAQQLAQQRASAIPLSGQVVSISHTGTQSGTMHLRVSFGSVTGPTFQNPIPRPNIQPATPTQEPKGIKTLTVSFTKNTVFTTKNATDIKAGDYVSVRSATGDYASGNSFTATQVSYFDPITQIEQMVAGNGHTLFGKITTMKTVGSSKIVTIDARIVNEKEFSNTLLTKVATSPYPHTLLRSDVPFTTGTYTVTIDGSTHVNNVNGITTKLAIGDVVAINGKENINTTNKITALSLTIVPAPQTPSGK